MRDEGKLKIYALKNTSAAGYMPKEQLVELAEAYYAVKTIEIGRAHV